MPFNETRLEFDNAMKEFETANSDAKMMKVFLKWHLRMMFEVYGELSSLAVSYKKLLSLQESRTNGKTK